ncbi:cell division protein FtsQ/DivIB [Intestinibacter sp.]
MKKKKRKIRINRLITVLLFVFMVCIGTIVFIKSDFFSLRNIKIVNNNILTKSEINQLSKITIGRNLFTYNLEKIKSNIKESRYIQNVTVKKHIPSSIVINIEEKIISCILKDESNNYYYIDDNMKYIDKVEKNKLKEGYPIVEIDFTIKENKVTFADEEDKKVLISLINNIKKDGLDNKINSINLLKNNEITMKTEEGIKIILKKDGDIKHDIAKLTQILIDLKSYDVNYGKIDMTFSKYVLYTYQ